MKKTIAVLLSVLLVLSGLTGCNRSASVYPDASVTIPSTYTDYSFDNIRFKFEAGWESVTWDDVQTEMDTVLSSIQQSGQLALIGRLRSTATDKGTVNYIDVGYFEIGQNVTGQTLEGTMEAMDGLASALKKMGVRCDELQKSRIRCYGSQETEALTCCYQIAQKQDNSSSTDTVGATCVVQIGLIPYGTRVYAVMYTDFTSGKDNSSLEEILTGLTFR